TDPVNRTAAMAGWVTSDRPASSPYTTANVPPATPCWASAAAMTSPHRADRPGWRGWALTTTGQPAASALAVSPPATENANGKLLAAKTAIGTRGTIMRRQHGTGAAH